MTSLSITPGPGKAALGAGTPPEAEGALLPVHRARYNQDDDRLALYPAERLSAEDQQRVMRAGLRWGRGSGAFVGYWTPAREDLLLAFAPSIEVVNEPDDALGRIQRRGEYAEQAQTRTDQARQAEQAILGVIPPGQPILHGHHSARRHRRDLDRAQGHHRRAGAEQAKAEYHQARAEGAERRAQQKQNPNVIARRLYTLEAELRGIRKRAALNDAGAAYARRWVKHLEGRVAFERSRLNRLSGETGHTPLSTADFRVGEQVGTPCGRAEVLKVAPTKMRVRLLDGEHLSLPPVMREWLERPDRLHKTPAVALPHARGGCHDRADLAVHQPGRHRTPPGPLCPPLGAGGRDHRPIRTEPEGTSGRG